MCQSRISTIEGHHLIRHVGFYGASEWGTEHGSLIYLSIFFLSLNVYSIIMIMYNVTLQTPSCMNRKSHENIAIWFFFLYVINIKHCKTTVLDMNTLKIYFFYSMKKKNKLEPLQRLGIVVWEGVHNLNDLKPIACSHIKL